MVRLMSANEDVVEAYSKSSGPRVLGVSGLSIHQSSVITSPVCVPKLSR